MSFLAAETDLLTLATPGSSSSSSNDLAALAAAARLTDVLAAPTARALLAPFARLAGTAAANSSGPDFGPGSAALVRLPPACTSDSADARHAEQLSVLSVAAAALQLFVQENWTGPDAALSPTQALRPAAPDAFPPRAVDADEADDDNALEARLQSASLEGLTWAGEPAYHLCRAPFFLLFAIRVLDALAATPAPLPTVAWWRLRAATVHSHILDEPVPYGPAILKPVAALLDALKAQVQQPSSSSAALVSQHMLALLTLEHGLAVQRMGRDKDAAEQFVQAAKTHRLLYQLSGALGKRTKFQKEDRVQLLLLAESSANSLDLQNHERIKADEKRIAADANKDAKEEDPSQDNPANWGWNTAPDPEQDASVPSTFLLNDDTLLEQTAFTATTSDNAASTSSSLSHIDPSNQPALAPLDQCILLALSLSIRNTSPTHGLTASEISAFVARVLPHPQNWSVHTMALLLRSRLESGRTRTVERSVLQLQALIDQMPTSDSSARERLAYFHALELPARWEMQAELAKRYASIGVTRSALEIFERIEFWEEVVQCLGSLGRQEEGIEVVRDLLEGRKVEADVEITRRRKQDTAAPGPARMTERMVYAREAKLWCLLGDLEPLQAKAHYEKAWDISRRSSARAARSLGGYYFARADYPEAARWLRAALKTNPLYSRSWFILGCALMRLERWADAAIAFARCVALVEDDGESWNNLASCYLQMGEEAARRVAQVEANGGDAPFLEGEGDEDADEMRSEADSEQSFGTDSAVDLPDADDAGATQRQRRSATPYRLRLLAHRALQHSIKYSHDSWRVWANYMVVSVDAGELAEACRALRRVVELRSRSAKTDAEKAEAVDFDVLDRLVRAVTSAPSDPAEAAAAAAADPSSANINEGHGLRPALEALFSDVLLARISSSVRLWAAYARLLLWKRDFAGCVRAHMEAYQHGAGDAANEDVLASKAAWLEGVREVEDLVDVLENLGGREVGEGGGAVVLPEWRFKARSVVRLFMGRSKALYGDEPEWERLVELKGRL